MVVEDVHGIRLVGQQDFSFLCDDLNEFLHRVLADGGHLLLNALLKPGILIEGSDFLVNDAGHGGVAVVVRHVW